IPRVLEKSSHSSSSRCLPFAAPRRARLATPLRSNPIAVVLPAHAHSKAVPEVAHADSPAPPQLFSSQARRREPAVPNLDCSSASKSNQALRANLRARRLDPHALPSRRQASAFSLAQAFPSPKRGAPVARGEPFQSSAPNGPLSAPPISFAKFQR